MVKTRSVNTIRINARQTDVFDIFNFKYYVGPNPYLETRSLVFDFSLTEYRQPLAIREYAAVISDRYPHLEDQEYDSYGDLLAHIVSQVLKLNMGWHFNRWSIKQFSHYARIGIQSLDEDTTRAIVYFVWDWLESITQDQEFSLESSLIKLQNDFRKSVYGTPTVYALLQTADTLGIPHIYLRTERLVQYGYGKKQVRASATTFDCDSHLDIEFMAHPDECQEFLRKLGFPIPPDEMSKNSQERDFCLLCIQGKFVVAVERHLLDNTSINAVNTVHEDNIILAQDIAEYFRLTCLVIQVMTENLATSWKSGNFSILAIHQTLDMFMNLQSTLGKSINIPTHILTTFFPSPANAKIPIITFNRISVRDLQTVVDHILRQRPNWKIGAVCQGGLFVNKSQQLMNQDYNSNLQGLLRHPQLDLLIAEYPENILEKLGMFYQGSNIVVLDNPSETEMMVLGNIMDKSIIIFHQETKISIHTQGLIENYTLNPDQPLSSVYLSEINSIL